MFCCKQSDKQSTSVKFPIRWETVSPSYSIKRPGSFAWALWIEFSPPWGYSSLGMHKQVREFEAGFAIADIGEGQQRPYAERPCRRAFCWNDLAPSYEPYKSIYLRHQGSPVWTSSMLFEWAELFERSQQTAGPKTYFKWAPNVRMHIRYWPTALDVDSDTWWAYTDELEISAATRFECKWWRNEITQIW